MSLTWSPLPRSFYARSVLVVARECIGKVIVHETPDGIVAGRIVEAEAYRGPEDRAAHSFGGRRTRRTEAMYGPAGFAYVFLIYGIHHHLNLVTGEVGQPHAVLVRAIEPVAGVELMAERRGVPSHRVTLCNGPGKLCRALGVDLGHYGADLCASPLFLADGSRGRVLRSPRIGVEYAGTWAQRPWRLHEAANRYVSSARSARLAAR